MNREKKLVKNTIIVAIGKICTQFISFFLLPLYTALLSTEEYGTVDLVNTIVTLLIPIVFLQLEQAIFRYLIDVRTKKEKENEIISTSFFAMIFLSMTSCVIFIIVNTFIENPFKNYILILLIVSGFSNYLLQMTRGLDDNVLYSQGSLVAGVGTIILNVILIAAFRLGAHGMILSSIVSNMLCIVFIFYKKKIYNKIRCQYYKKDILKQLLKYSIPLIPNQLSWWVINAFDRAIILFFLGISSNGIYSAANKFSSIVISLFNIFNLTWSESAAISINDEDKDIYFSNIFNKALKFCSALCIGIIAFMPFIFEVIITGEGYKNAYYQIPIILISVYFNVIVSLCGSIYIALKKSNEIAKTSLLAAIINIIINITLIKYIGLYAASISTLISYMSMGIYRIIDVKKYIKINLDMKYILSLTLLTIITLICYYIRSKILCLFIVFIVCIHSFKYNIDLITEIYKLFKKKLNDLKQISNNI